MPGCSLRPPAFGPDPPSRGGLIAHVLVLVATRSKGRGELDQPIATKTATAAPAASRNITMMISAHGGLPSPFL